MTPPRGLLAFRLQPEVVHLRARHYLSTEPRPFLRWAGSKRARLQSLLSTLPGKFNTYREPFLGGASLFFLLQPRKAVLSDASGELIESFLAVRDNVSAVLRCLGPLRPRKSIYYRVRNARSSGRFQRAAEFIFLNKSCWNGLYRVNSDGAFNVPCGRPKTDFIVSESNLRACSRALRPQGVKLATCDFADALDGAQVGDLVYLDPPYVTGHRNNGLIDYNETLFSWDDQERLAKLALRRRERGSMS